MRERRRERKTGTADYHHQTQTDTKDKAACSQSLQHLCQGSEADMVNQTVEKAVKSHGDERGQSGKRGLCFSVAVCVLGAVSL